MMAKIAIFELEEWEESYLNEKLSGHELFFTADRLTEKSLSQIKDTEILSTFIYSKLSQEILSKLHNLKLIATRSTGFDHIDTKYCDEHGITVCNVPTYGVNTVAEHTFSLILALSRKLIDSVNRTRRGDFGLEGLRGSELAGKTLGIVGLGHIGSRVAELACAFKMKVIATVRHPDPQLTERFGITFCDLPTLLAQADIVSLHVPATPETTHLINKDNITSMKKGSYLINTARGAIVETEAILWALEQGILAGAGLDVLEEECVLKEERQLITKEFLESCNLKTQLLNHVLLTKDNVVITPHNAFNSQEALTEILKTTITNITAWIDGKTVNRVKLR